MHLLLGLFLIVTTVGAIAQRSNTVASDPAPPNTIHDSPAGPADPEAAKSTSTEASRLPDAPSSMTQRSSSDPSILRPAQLGKLATPNNAGSSALVFVGATSSATVAGAPQRQFNEGANGSGGICTRDTGGKTDGTGWITSLLSITSKGPHYCALGEGGFWRRGTYAMGRAFAAHSNDGAKTFNTSGLFAPGSSAGMTAAFSNYQGYAYQYDAGQRMATRYATAVGRDVLKNLFREFMPDVSTHVLHRRP